MGGWIGGGIDLPDLALARGVGVPCSGPSWVLAPSPCGQTCENSTFPHPSDASGNDFH